MYWFSSMFSTDIRFSIADMLLYIDIQLLYILFVFWFFHWMLCRMDFDKCIISAGMKHRLWVMSKITGVIGVVIFIAMVGYLSNRVYGFWLKSVDLAYIMQTWPKTAIDYGIVIIALFFIVFIGYGLYKYALKLRQVLGEIKNKLNHKGGFVDGDIRLKY